MKSEEKFTFTINFVMVVLVITSITLTIIESVESIMTPDLRSFFLSIHFAILGAFLAELLYRIWSAPLVYPDDTPLIARLRFIFHPLTLIDIIVIAPLFMMIWTHDLHNADTVILRLLRFTSILNSFHFYRSSKVLQILRDMGREIWFEMLVIFILSLQCILIAGVLFYAIELGKNPHVTNIFDGIWWSVITLSTIGYGDIAPMTVGGRILAMFLALLGVGLVALPTGILTSGFVRAVKNDKKISDITRAVEDEIHERDNMIDRIHQFEQKNTTKKSKPSVATSKIFR